MISYRIANSLVDAYLAFEVIKHLDDFYPNFTHWYFNRAVPGMMTGDDRLIIAEDAGIVGMALVKKNPLENKLRCVRVLPSYQSRGVGLHLIDRALRTLDDPLPACSVSEEMIDDFARILVNRFEFNLNWVDKGAYRPGKLEYIFNSRDVRQKQPL